MPPPSSQQQPQQQEPMSVIMYRVQVIESDLAALKAQLKDYEPLRENTLKMQRIQEIVNRMDSDLAVARSKIETMSEGQNALWMKLLWGAVGTVGSVVVAVLIYLITHHLS